MTDDLAPLCGLKIGDAVRLQHGYALMLVVDLLPLTGDAVCAWRTSNGILAETLLPAKVLRRVPAAEYRAKLAHRIIETRV